MAAEFLFSFPTLTVAFSNLAVVGTGAGDPTIIQANESFDMSVDVVFAPAGTPLDVFLSAPLTIETSFQVEGFGNTTTEANLSGTLLPTASGTYTYKPTFTGNPTGAGLLPGVYSVAVAVTLKFGALPLALGFVSETFFQVY